MLLKEDKVTDYIKKLIINNSRFPREMLDTPVAELPEDVQGTLRGAAGNLYAACVRNGQDLKALLRLYFLSYFDISHGKGPTEYVFGLARIAIGELGMFRDTSADSQLSELKQVVMFLHDSGNAELKSKYNSDLNGLSFNGIVRELNGDRRVFNAANRERLSRLSGNASDYTVVQINSFEEVEKYGQYTSWCVTHGRNNYDAYVRGGRRFYFCLKKGFEDVPEQVTEGCPLDVYGLSMISVLVDAEGEPNYVTTRWNHAHDGENNENLRTAEQVQQVTGLNFYQTFKPYTLEELRAMGITPLYAVQEELDNGTKPEELFDEIGDFQDGYARVRLNNKYNFISTKNRLLSDTWFDSAGYFHDGYARVKLNWEWNFINTEGRLLLGTWLDWISEFCEGYAKVELDRKYNLINTEGRLLSDTWFDWISKFCEGYAKVELDRKYNFINTEGRLLSDTWFDEFGDFHEGLARVKLNWKWNLINTEGRLLLGTWLDFDTIEDFHEGYATVELNSKYNLINTEGRLLSDTWFNEIGPFQNGYIWVRPNWKWYKMDKDGKLHELNESKIAKPPVLTESIIRAVVKECVRRILE